MSERRREIVAAAATIFRKKGYSAATIQEIADAVGLLKGSLYYHIESKEQLLIEVMLSSMDKLQSGLRRVVDTDLSPLEKLQGAIVQHMNGFDTNFDEASVFLNEASNLPRGLWARVNIEVTEYEQVWLGIIEAGMEAGQFRPDITPRITLQAIFGMCNWTHKWFRPGGLLTATQIGERYADIMLKGMVVQQEERCGEPAGTSH